ncbi:MULTISPECIES: hypothetical protein [Nostoc]|uniref:Uncharacterized protein n=1 Tax=Nostoc paludosum FACHB-159 TaxID=2692908 RepID=A0ABR8K2K0_9NOSO|nr:MULTISPECIES: hypothetical protein [Nostoc]MBD2732974.1 hypothetical protein [Nostoc paludosum FACHB-159]
MGIGHRAWGGVGGWGRNLSPHTPHTPPSPLSPCPQFGNTQTSGVRVEKW